MADGTKLVGLDEITEKKKTRMEIQSDFSRVLSRKAKWLFLFVGLGAGAISFDTRAEDADIDASFNQFDGYEVKFDYENHPKEREIAYEYYLKEYGVDEFHPLSTNIFCFFHPLS